MAARPSEPDSDPDELRDIVDSLISGMSLARVPEELHRRLLVPLSAAKNEAIVAGNTPTVKRIQSVMHELKLNPGKSSRTPSRGGSAFLTARSLREEQHDDLQVIITELLDGRTLETCDYSILQPLVSALKERKQEALSVGDYHQSQQLENLIREANSLYYAATYRSQQSSRLTGLRVQLLKAREDLDAAEQFWKDAKIRQDEEYATSLTSLESQQREQLEDFDNSFPEILPANFRKLSSRLLHLREQERHLVLSKRYDDAIPFRELADQLEHEELEAQRAKFLRAFQVQRQQLIEAQAGQRGCFERNWERKKERLQKDREHELDIFRRTISIFEGKIAAVETGAEVGAAMSAGPTPRAQTRASSVVVRQVQRASANPRARNVAAGRMSQKKCLVERAH